MTRVSAVLPMALLAAAGTAFALPAISTVAQATTVNVTANCEPNSVTVTVSPWEARVERSDSVAWSFAGADSMDIVPLNRGGRAWPFVRSNPGRARGNERAQSGRVSPNAAAGVSHFYQIRLFCGAREIVIDPEVIILDDE